MFGNNGRIVYVIGISNLHKKILEAFYKKYENELVSEYNAIISIDPETTLKGYEHQGKLGKAEQIRRTLMEMNNANDFTDRMTIYFSLIDLVIDYIYDHMIGIDKAYGNHFKKDIITVDEPNLVKALVQFKHRMKKLNIGKIYVVRASDSSTKSQHFKIIDAEKL